MTETASINLKWWERLLVVLAFLLFIASTWIFFSPILLQKVLLGWDPVTDSQGTLVAQLASVNGDVKRQFAAQPTFSTVVDGESLYDGDTILTGSNSTTRIVFNDGAYVDLAPNSLVILTFESSFQFGGFGRAPKVVVVDGSAKAVPETKIQRRAKPRKRFVATELAKLEPLDKSSFWGDEIPQVKVQVTSPADLIVQLSQGERVKTIYLQEEKTRSEFVYDISKFANPGQIATTIYQALPRNKKRKLGRTEFEVKPERREFAIESILIAGGKKNNQVYSGKKSNDFYIDVKVSGFNGKEVDFSKAYLEYKIEKAKKPYRYKLKNRTLRLFSGRVQDGKVRFQVKGVTDSKGFVETSEPAEIEFFYLPPQLVNPKQNSILDNAEVKKTNAVVLTWKKTDFTDEYVVEVASDKRFKKIIERQRTGSNFLPLRNLKPGTYYWRVACKGRGIRSKFSSPFKFQFKP